MKNEVQLFGVCYPLVVDIRMYETMTNQNKATLLLRKNFNFSENKLNKIIFFSVQLVQMCYSIDM